MQFQCLPINSADERLSTLRPRHWAALKELLGSLKAWDERQFFNGLDALGWSEKRIPLRIMDAERAEWEQSPGSPPYGRAVHPLFSAAWYQQFIHRFFPQKGRFTFASKKGMGLVFAPTPGILLRTLYTDFPLLSDMDKIGVGLAIASAKDEQTLKEALSKQSPRTGLPIMVVLLP